MSLLLAETDYLIRLRRQAEDIRLRLEASAIADITAGALASWAGATLFSGSAPEDPQGRFEERLAQHDGKSPVEWCKRRKLPLSDTVAQELGAYTFAHDAKLSDETVYIMGRALMMAALENPSKSQGLTLPLQYIENFGNHGMAWVGAMEWLSRQKGKIEPAVLSAVDAEIRVYAAKPLTRNRLPDNRYIEAGVEHWKSATGIEQALGIGAYSGLVDPPIRPILMTLAKSIPKYVATRLDKLGLPAFVSGALGDRYETDEKVLVELLRFAPPIVTRTRKWTRSVTARLVLDEVEERCIQMLEDRNRQLRVMGKPLVDDSQVKDFVDSVVATFMPTLLKRSDGARLAAEWVAHLIDASIARAKHPAGGRQGDLKLLVTDMLLRAVSRSLAQRREFSADRIWTLLGGAAGALVAPTSGDWVAIGERSNSGARAHWLNSRGEVDHISPFMVSVQCASEADQSNDNLVVWAVGLLISLPREPYLSRLGRDFDPSAASYLAWPLGKSANPSALVDAIWGAILETRMFARSKGARDDLESVDSCAAVVVVSIGILWSSSQNLSVSSRQSLALKIASMLDELRNGMPTIGLAGWDILIGRLASMMASTQLLEDAQTVEGLLSRYIGTDSDLVAAIVNAARTDVIRGNIVSALDAQRLDAKDLAERWALWTKRNYPNANPLGGEFYKQLVEIGQLQG